MKNRHFTHHPSEGRKALPVWGRRRRSAIPGSDTPRSVPALYKKEEAKRVLLTESRSETALGVAALSSQTRQDPAEIRRYAPLVERTAIDSTGRLAVD